MISVVVSYLKFHYITAYKEGFSLLSKHGLALLFVGIPLFIIWTLLPIVLFILFTAGLYLIFLWNII